MAVDIRLLGHVRARVGGREVDLGAAQQRCVLVALAVDAREPVSADQLVHRVWGDRVPLRAKETLRTYLTRLRKALGDEVGIVRRAGGYVLEVDPAAVDLHRFRGLVERARAAGGQADELYGQALELWRGEPFSGLDTRWVNEVRAALEREHWAALLDHTDALLRRGRHAELVPDLVARAAAHPLDERVAGQLVLALYRSGRQAEALEHYRRVRDELAEQLGVDPGPELQDMHRRILGADRALAVREPSPATAKPHQLPSAVRHFVGRAGELEALTAWAEDAARHDDAVSIACVTGIPGVGKTSLAVSWARRNRDRFPDGQLYADLRGFDPAGAPLSPEEAIRGFLDAFGVPAHAVPAEPGARAALYRSLLEGKRMLLVLDNARDTDQVRALLPHDAGCPVLVTSRRQLSGLVAREHAHHIRLDALDAAEARDLLATFVGWGRVAAEAEAVEQITRRCAHLPLALCIAGARASAEPGLPLATLVADLNAERRLLSALSTSDSADTDLRSVFSWSYRACPSPGSARLFRRLADHPGPDIAIATAAALAGVGEDEARAALTELAEANLVQHHRPGRYQQHDLLRAYADEVARAADDEVERRAATTRCLDHYLAKAASAMALVDPRGSGASEFPDRAAAVAWLDAEYHNLLASAAHAAAHGWHEHAWRLPCALQYFFDIRGRVDDWLRTHGAALEAARELADERAEAEVRKGLTIVCWLTSRLDEALEHSGRALTLYRRSGDRSGEAELLNLRGLIEERVGRYHDALRHFGQALALRQGTGQHRGEAVALQNLGNVLDVLGRLEEALDHYQRALVRFRESGERRAEAIVLINVGIVRKRLGRLDDAVAAFQEALVLTEEGDHWVTGNALTGLGTALGALGRREEAVEHHREALRLIRAVGDRAAESAVLNNLGVVHLAEGDAARALSLHREALALAVRARHRHEEARAHDGIASAVADRDPATARHHWTRAIAVYDEIGAPVEERIRRALASLPAP
ncbi:DNA-binding SARP family transcriptional activator/Flp pilus assembly protein TadD [Saccharothrix coeruleofusca]|uniref:AfsR/SARP family transcriptional regulator n=1 Tax=Saccharothrix coeruleofusca TaxID=33919 RepID=UPI001AE8506C|nr:tetratricopeptide repeat protein [Saccharothrix coeruleofusca]MBP2335751.1 DNA-binding SARP family transcriptional activator/Flp pilus assembly protein TadD [Saccharothrix coeruleofusca]